MVGVIVTNGNSHAPENWADWIANELVPLMPNASDDLIVKVRDARRKLRLPIIEAMAAIRDHERAAFAKFTKNDTAALIAAVKGQRGEKSDVHMNDLHRFTKGKVRSAEHWLDQYVRKICQTACECDGDRPPSNEMIDNVHTVLARWVNSIQSVERAHFVTSNALI